MLNGLLVSLLLSITTFTAIAQPTSRPIAPNQLPSWRFDDYDLEKYERLRNDSNTRYSEAKRRFDRVTIDFNQSIERGQRLNQDFQSRAQRLEVLLQQNRELQRTMEQNQADITRADQAVTKLDSEITSLQALVNSTNSVINDLKTRLAGTADEAQKQELQRQIQTQTDVLNNLNGQMNAKVQESQQVKRNRENAQGQLDRNNRQISSNDQEAHGVRNQVVEIQRQIERNRLETIEIRRALDLANGELQSRAQEIEISQRNIENVRRNIEIARQVLSDQGNRDGANDGNREGIDLGTERGQRDGRAQGSTEGQRQGITDGRARDYSAGYEKGKAQAIQDANRQSEIDAQANGTRDGLAQGRIDGLKNAYNLGLNEGLKHGAETGDDRDAYREGRSEGEAKGLAKAVTDAKPQEGLGYQSKENEYLSAPLQNVVIGNPATARRFEGLQGRFSDDGDDRYYNPRPGNLPHSRLEAFYRGAYDQSYRRELGEAYRVTYRREYDNSYNSNYRRSYDENFRVDYADSRKSGEGQGYQDTYKPRYDANYKVRYAQVYKTNYDDQFEKFKLDVAERARGFKDGNRTASRAKGMDEGFQAAYAANIEIEKTKAFAAGVARAKQLYDNNPVIKVSSLEIVDVDGDGIYRPGENLAVVIKLKNFGLKSKSDLSSQLTEASGAIRVNQASLSTGTIPNQSSATVIVPVQSLVPSSAVDGNSFSVRLSAVTGSTVYLSAVSKLAVQYPTLVSVVGFDGILIPGVSTNVRLKVLNRSNSVQNLNLGVAVHNEKVVISQDQFQVTQLSPKSEREVVVNLVGKAEARFEESPLAIRTFQGSLQFAMNLDQVMTIIRRHSPTNESKGLIISQNLAVGAGKKLFGLDKFDTWDLRVDGSIKNLSSLESYRGKVLHIMADAESSADAQTLATLQQFIASNGSAIIWGGSLDRSSLAEALMSMLGVSVSSNSASQTTAVQGMEKLRGVAFSYRGSLTPIEHSSEKGSYALNSSAGALGVIVFGNGIDARTGQVAVVGLDLNAIQETSVKALMTQFDVIRGTFDEKISRAVASPGQQMWLVAQEMMDEMISAEQLGTGRYYRDNMDSSKIVRSTKRMIGDAGRNSAQARELAKFYPQLSEFIQARLPNEQWNAALALDKRHGSFFSARNLKDLFCEANSGHPLCQESGQ